MGAKVIAGRSGGSEKARVNVPSPRAPAAMQDQMSIDICGRAA
jgi:hypothetical protein